MNESVYKLCNDIIKNMATLSALIDRVNTNTEIDSETLRLINAASAIVLLGEGRVFRNLRRAMREYIQ